MSQLEYHMRHGPNWPVWLLISVVAGYLTLLLRRNSEVKAFKKRTQSRDPSHYPHTDKAWGSDLVRDRMLAMKEGRFFRLYLQHFQQHGKTFLDKVRGHKTINTMEARNVQHVLAFNTEDYIKDSARVRAQRPFLGPSVFSDGPYWKQSRAMVKPIFDRAELSDMDQLAAFTKRFMDLIPGDGTTTDMQGLMQRLFLDVSTDFILGEPAGGLDDQLPAETSKFLAAFFQAQRWVTKRREAGWMSRRYDYSRDWINSYKKVHRFIDKRVEHALSTTKPDTKQAASIESTNINKARKRFVLIEELAKQIRDPIVLRYQILGILLPAHDTTARVAGNALFQLARHPHEWSKLREVALSRGQDPLTFEKLKSLVEFKHVIFETIRTVGPVARVVREAIRNTVLPVGGGDDGQSPCFVPRGATVSMSTWSMCHDRDTWGDDVEEFKPERWVGRKTYWEFVPFSGGPRICPAQQQVITHVTFLLVKLVQRFETIENRDPVLEYVEQFKMVPESKNGVQVAFWQAK